MKNSDAGADPVKQRLAALRSWLQHHDCDGLVIPRADEFLGEYLPEHNERLHWATGFTGSAGLALVLADRAAIFVDGRYTVQVRRQVDACCYEFCSLPEESPLDWLSARLPSGSRVVCDTRLHTLRWYRQALSQLAENNIELVADIGNPIDEFWQDRPQAVIEEALLLPQRYTGESSSDKRRRIGRLVEQRNCDVALVFSPDSVSWLLNIRGRDIPRLPVVQSFALLSADGRLSVCLDPGRVPAGFTDHVGDGVDWVDSRQAEQLLSCCGGKRVLADPDSANAWTQLLLEHAGATLVSGTDPVLIPKACKNPVELEGARSAHRRDAVAVIRFLSWLDAEVEAGRRHDEASLAERLGELRAGGEHFQDFSFDTISAAGANASLCHYNHRDGDPAGVPADSLYLVDSGGHYLDGTTDITRTVAIGEPDRERRKLFTLVLKGHIALDRARFPQGTTGTQLDGLARQYLWQAGFDYDHGTGHGVGAFLSVHEGPQRIAKQANTVALRPGMIVSNEPGYYRDGEFGIRCENLVVVTEVEDIGGDRPMLGFEALTLVPFDQRLVVVELLDDTELDWLNVYHHRVRQDMQPRLDGRDRDWLIQATQPLVRHSH